MFGLQTMVDEDEAQRLSERYDGHGPEEILRGVLRDDFPGSVAVVSSFGAESAVLLRLVAAVDPSIPVIFLDTLAHFPETLAYRDLLAARLGLSDVRSVWPDTATLATEDAPGTLFQRDPDRCCHIRKTAPMTEALAGFSCWISGRKRFQSATRSNLPLFENEDGRIKLNLLAHADRAWLDQAFAAEDLPRHPLTARGYPSIGCAPCTAPVAEGQTDQRAGRWAGQAKTECGIHMVGGKMVRIQRS